ncbi:MAG: DUF47 family protein [Desulfitobacteriaceae bacterium]|nr:DUF47 family protein [Desulfitobacteriaceae bacterium]
MASDNDKNIKPKANQYFEKFLHKFINEKVDYYDIFIKDVSISLKAAKSLKTIISNSDIDHKELLHIKEFKKIGSKHVNESLKIVEKAFITPIDQKDIIEILKGMEDILHSIHSIANHLYIMNITIIDEFMLHFVEIIISICEKLYDLMVAFKQFNKHGKENIYNLIEEISKLEEEGDRTYSECMIRIFSFETDAITILKKKEIYQRLEYSLDCFKRVADMIGNLIIATM